MNRQKKLITATVIIVALFFSGCATPTTTLSKPESTSSSLEQEDFFEEKRAETITLGKFGHVATNLIIENNKAMPFIYSGKEVELQYRCEISGANREAGFILLLDGVPQIYRTSLQPENYSYLHTIQVPSDDLPYDFTIYFNPSVGKSGDTLSLEILGVFNPNFKPDNDKTLSYGMYHTAIVNVYSLLMNNELSVEKSSFSPAPSYSFEYSESTQIIDEKFLALQEKFAGLEKSDLEKMVYSQTSLNGVFSFDEIVELDESGSVEIQYALFGLPGVETNTTFYLDHVPLSENGKVKVFSQKIQKSEASIITLKLSGIDSSTVFYAITQPSNAELFGNAPLLTRKSASKLLW